MTILIGNKRGEILDISSKDIDTIEAYEQTPSGGYRIAFQGEKTDPTVK